MPRRNRIHYRHAFYHVMLRGNYQQEIFHDKASYLSYYDTIQLAVETFGCRVHLFCLMTNHVHLVIEVGDIPLSKIMQNMNVRYTKIVNKRFHRKGHLFEGRYIAKLIQNDQYLLELCYYIHMNPIKAKICESLDSYPWSSHHAYCHRKNLTWLTTSHINDLLASHIAEAKRCYLEFMLDRENKLEEPSSFEINGSGEITIKDSVARARGEKPSLAIENVAISKIIKVVCKYLHVSEDVLDSAQQDKKLTLARVLIAYYAHYHAKSTLQDIAAVFDREPGSLSKTMHRYVKQSETNAELRRKFEAIERNLSISDIDKLIG